MANYLLLQLYTPLCSFGGIAVGENRHTQVTPTRSALLGLLAAALGIERCDEARLHQFNQHYHFATLPLNQRQQWLVDYHTIQKPTVSKERTYYTRRDEIIAPTKSLETTLSNREYLQDVYYLVAISMTAQAPYCLEQLATALRQPIFPLYLGRKSCPLALPLAPRLQSHETLAQAFEHALQHLEPALDFLHPASHQPLSCYWQQPAAVGINVQFQHRRHDQPLSRRRWQFGTRIEYQGELRRS